MPLTPQELAELEKNMPAEAVARIMECIGSLPAGTKPVIGSASSAEKKGGDTPQA